jgi:hypothetical protein
MTMMIEAAYALLDPDAEEFESITIELLQDAVKCVNDWASALEEQRRQLALEIAEHDEKLAMLNGMLAKLVLHYNESTAH